VSSCGRGHRCRLAIRRRFFSDARRPPDMTRLSPHTGGAAVLATRGTSLFGLCLDATPSSLEAAMLAPGMASINAERSTERPFRPLIAPGRVPRATTIVARGTTAEGRAAAGDRFVSGDEPVRRGRSETRPQPDMSPPRIRAGRRARHQRPEYQPARQPARLRVPPRPPMLIWRYAASGTTHPGRRRAWSAIRSSRSSATPA